jgi:hypothetical protein
VVDDEKTGEFQLPITAESSWKTLLWDVLSKFFSRKLFFSLVSISLVVEAVVRVASLKLDNTVMIIALPFMITAIAVICVTYLTGQAKIDVQANIQGPK